MSNIPEALGDLARVCVDRETADMLTRAASHVRSAEAHIADLEAQLATALQQCANARRLALEARELVREIREIGNRATPSAQEALRESRANAKALAHRAAVNAAIEVVDLYVGRDIREMVLEKLRALRDEANALPQESSAANPPEIPDSSAGRRSGADQPIQQETCSTSAPEATLPITHRAVAGAPNPSKSSNGSGGSSPCDACDGSGEVVVEWSTPNEHGQDTQECDHCDGSGKASPERGTGVEHVKRTFAP
jgi:hypothetical protein